MAGGRDDTRPQSERFEGHGGLADEIVQREGSIVKLHKVRRRIEADAILLKIEDPVGLHLLAVGLEGHGPDGEATTGRHVHVFLGRVCYNITVVRQSSLHAIVNSTGNPPLFEIDLEHSRCSRSNGFCRSENVEHLEARRQGGSLKIVFEHEAVDLDRKLQVVVHVRLEHSTSGFDARKLSPSRVEISDEPAEISTLLMPDTVASW